MADYDNLTVGQLVETAAHINGWQKLRRLLYGGTRLHDLADGASIGPVTGEYTGDGGATQTITLANTFTPRIVMIYAQTDNASPGGYPIIKTNQDGTFAQLNGNQYEEDHVVSLGSGEFVVADGTGSTNGNAANVSARVYTYIAWP